MANQTNPLSKRLLDDHPDQLYYPSPIVNRYNNFPIENNDKESDRRKNYRKKNPHLQRSRLNNSEYHEITLNCCLNILISCTKN